MNRATVMPAFRERSEMIAVELRSEAGLAIQLLDNGSIFSIRHGDVMVNQVLGSLVEGGIGNVYLRRRGRDGISAFPLLGPAGSSVFRPGQDASVWAGTVDGLAYSCTLRLAPTEPTWFWSLSVTNATDRRLSLDAVLAQDLGIAHEAAVRSNELYTSQYIDHTILEDPDLGVVICSRQNLPQGDVFPWVMHGCLDGAAGFLTDGFQFYGLDYKTSNAPTALSSRRLPSRNYQYEFALPTLQSRPLTLAAGADATITFFATYAPDHPAATSDADLAFARAAQAAFRSIGRRPAGREARPRAASVFDAPVAFESYDLDEADLERFFGTDRRHVERRDGVLLSFFRGSRQHVVLKAKEAVQERPTGHIMRSGRDLLPSDDILSVTTWMFGVFASQLTIGNTSFNKLLGVCRNPLNVLQSSGLRIFLRNEGGYELLAMPSAFEMDLNSGRWVYRGARHTIVVGVTTSLDAPICRLQLKVEAGGPVELLLSHNVVLGENEYGPAGHIVADAGAGRVELRPAPTTPVGTNYPDATFLIVCPDPGQIDAIGGDELLYADRVGRGGPFVVVKTKPVEQFALTLTGNVLDARRAEQLAAGDSAADGERQRSASVLEANPHPEAERFWQELGNRASLAGGRDRFADDLARLNDLLGWYLHDAMIHYTTPHGLEQYSGAAWGLRDVCQGPVELLLATRNMAPLREVLKTVFEHQSPRTHDWPQWFMFDRYREIRAADSHADIIHWPMKALCDYVEATGDYSILEEQVAYTDERSGRVTAETNTIFGHIEGQVARIERDCIPGTALPVFGGGDWEDTLQPADPAMARRLVSAWTVELAYQTLGRYHVVCERAGKSAMAHRLAELCVRIRSDFQRYLMPDGVVAGLAHFASAGVEYFLHPRDRKTGVSYRLLPMTRGMISGIFSSEEAKRHLALIESHLTFPDGVRLMNRPMDYHGGTSRYFRRAESAANFGREVGLQYVHAHIRYIEAMARLGRPEEALWGLLAICPITLERDVPSALPRQSNAFFSSSDADFMDRRQASRRFGRVRTGRVGVKGGWRVYSSGPGIYINQLVSNVLGIRTYFEDVLLDPVLPARADGAAFDFAYEGRAVRYLYHVAGDGFAPREVRVNGRPLPADGYADNPYRRGGVLISKGVFSEALDRDHNLVELFI